VTYLGRCSFLGGDRNFSLGNCVQTVSEDREDNGSSTRGRSGQSTEADHSP